MNRRSLLKRLGAAAVAAPVLAVTATGTTEAADDQAVRDARAEGYNRGYDVASARADSRAATLAKQYTDGLVTWDESRSICDGSTPTELEESKRILAAYWQSPEGQAELTRQTQELMGKGEEYGALRFRKGYDQGLARGMQARAEAMFDPEANLLVSTASIDGKYVAAAREIKPNTIVPLMGNLVVLRS